MRSPLVSFADHCKDKRGVDRVDELTDQDLRDYSESLYDRSKIDEELAASTAQKLYCTFLAYILADYYRRQYPVHGGMLRTFRVIRNYWNRPLGEYG